MISAPPDPKPQPTPGTAGGGGASQSVYRVGPNLLANPSFEAGWDGWRSSGPPGCALVSKADQASSGTNAVRFLKADRSRGWIEQDITELLKQAGPGDYTWAAKVRGGTAGIPVKASLVVEDESGTQQHPAPDAQTLAEDWAKTERRTPIKWGELKRAALRIESTWGPNGEFIVDECWLSR